MHRHGHRHLRVLPALWVWAWLAALAAGNTNSSSTQPHTPQPTLAECEQFRGVSYLNTTDAPWQIDRASDEGIPPLLLSYPGSGNTFLRTLLEFALGVHSCSIYMTDKELQQVFPGEHICDRKCLVVKGHPSDFIIRGQMDLHNRLSKGGDKRDKLRGTSKFMRRKCAKGGIQHFSKAILLTRNPFPAILSDFQRVATNSHEGTLTLSMNETFHLRNVKRNPIAGKNMTAVWLAVAMEKAQDFGNSFRSVVVPLMLSNFSAPPAGVNKNPAFPHLDFSTVAIARYEDFVDKRTRRAALAALVRQAFPPALASRATARRLDCAFVLADRKNDIQRSKKLLSMDEVYNKVDPALPCAVWNHTRLFAQHFGYHASPTPGFGSIEQQCAGWLAGGGVGVGVGV